MNWANLYQRMRHKKTGVEGVYVEHANIGEGYMMQRDDGKGIIGGKYDDFEPIPDAAKESEK